MIRGELKYEGCPQHGISNPYVYSGSLLSKYLLPREACVTDDCIFLDETNNRDPPLIRAPHQSVINIGTSIEMLTNKKLTGSSNQSGYVVSLNISLIISLYSLNFRSGQASGGTVEIRNAQTPLNMATSSTDSPAIHTGLMR